MLKYSIEMQELIYFNLVENIDFMAQFMSLSLFFCHIFLDIISDRYYVILWDIDIPIGR